MKKEIDVKSAIKLYGITISESVHKKLHSNSV